MFFTLCVYTNLAFTLAALFFPLCTTNLYDSVIVVHKRITAIRPAKKKTKIKVNEDRGNACLSYDPRSRFDANKKTWN